MTCTRGTLTASIAFTMNGEKSELRAAHREILMHAKTELHIRSHTLRSQSEKLCSTHVTWEMGVTHERNLRAQKSDRLIYLFI